ncbi:DUF3892 domain-containing protein [Pseudomonas prosekii]|uniref:DUF3892 domain-containing protein n=1 Tax=Pseudomonas prosekii TaxID=1148509 RepID=UPI00387B7F50
MSNNDYYVSATDYNREDSHISKLKVHEVSPDGTLKKPVIMTRPQVVDLIKKQKVFCTMTQNAEGIWKRGAQLEVIQVTTDYLKTHKDASKTDNLENLPTI